MWSSYEQAEFKFLLEGRTRICCKILGGFVVRGEMLIEHRDSWFSTKSILVEYGIYILLGKATKNKYNSIFFKIY